MQCGNHPELTAVDRCAGCAESFCQNCLVPLGGQAYCASCKVLPLKSMPGIEEVTRECPEAAESLRFALISVLCICIPLIWTMIAGFVLAISSITKGATARKMIADNKQLIGYGRATAGMIIGVIITLVGALSLLASAG